MSLLGNVVGGCAYLPIHVVHPSKQQAWDEDLCEDPFFFFFYCDWICKIRGCSHGDDIRAENSGHQFDCDQELCKPAAADAAFLAQVACNTL